MIVIYSLISSNLFHVMTHFDLYTTGARFKEDFNPVNETLKLHFVDKNLKMLSKINLILCS